MGKVLDSQRSLQSGAILWKVLALAINRGALSTTAFAEWPAGSHPRGVPTPRRPIPERGVRQPPPQLSPPPPLQLLSSSAPPRPNAGKGRGGRCPVLAGSRSAGAVPKSPQDLALFGCGGGTIPGGGGAEPEGGVPEALLTPASSRSGSRARRCAHAWVPDASPGRGGRASLAAGAAPPLLRAAAAAAAVAAWWRRARRAAVESAES